MTPLYALLTLLTLITIHPPPAYARMGSDHGNPGNTVVREFTLTAQDIFNRMKLLPASELVGIDMNKLQGAILNVDVQSRETLVDPLDGEEKPAYNYPERNIIIVNRTMWNKLRSAEETENRLGLVLHEFLFFIGIDDTGFHVSNRLIPQLNVKEFSSGRFWNPLNPINYIATNLVYNPGDCQLLGLKFDTQVQEEEVTQETTGNCGDAYRKVTVQKSHLQAPPSSPWQGIFHRFEIHVFDAKGAELGTTTVEPEWGRCLLPSDGACQVGGKIFAGGVEFLFWFQR